MPIAGPTMGAAAAAAAGPSASAGIGAALNSPAGIASILTGGSLLGGLLGGGSEKTEVNRLDPWQQQMYWPMLYAMLSRLGRNVMVSPGEAERLTKETGQAVTPGFNFEYNPTKRPQFKGRVIPEPTAAARQGMNLATNVGNQMADLQQGQGGYGSFFRNLGNYRKGDVARGRMPTPQPTTTGGQPYTPPAPQQYAWNPRRLEGTLAPRQEIEGYPKYFPARIYGPGTPMAYVGDQPDYKGTVPPWNQIYNKYIQDMQRALRGQMGLA